MRRNIYCIAMLTPTMLLELELELELPMSTDIRIAGDICRIQVENNLRRLFLLKE